MTENLIIDGVDHAKFDLEWAKRGGALMMTTGNVLALMKVVEGNYFIIADFFKDDDIGWRKNSPPSHYLHGGEDLRMAIPAECEAAGIGYIEYHGWRPIESAPKNGYFIAKDANGVIFKSRRIRNDFEFFDVISGITIFANPTHWMPLPQPQKDE